MNRATLHTIATGILAVAVGVIAGIVRTPSDAKTAGQTATEPVEIAAPVAHAMKTETGVKRWLLLVAEAEKASEREMPGIIRAVGDDSAAVRMIAARWAELDPKHMFATLYADFLLPDGSPAGLPYRYYLVDALCEGWAKSDPAGAIQALTDVPKFSGLESMRISVFDHLMKTNVEAGIGAMNAWNIANFTPDLKAIAAWVAKDPKHAAEMATKNPAIHRDGISEVLKHVGKARGASDPEAGIRFAATLPEFVRHPFAAEIIGSWGMKDVEGAAKFIAAQTDISFRNALAPSLVRAWGKNDAAAALAWSEDNLTGAARDKAIGNLVASAAAKDLTAASELVSRMEEGTTQNRAAVSLFETWFGKGADQHGPAIEWLAELPDKAARDEALKRIGWSWIFKDPDAAREFVTGKHGHIASDSFIGQIVRSEALKDPEGALKWTDKLPAERKPAARAVALERWLEIRPAAAITYVSQLPPGPERTSAVRTTVETLITRAPEQVGAFLKTLPEAERTATMQTVPLDPKQRAKVEAGMK